MPLVFHPCSIVDITITLGIFTLAFFFVRHKVSDVNFLFYSVYANSFAVYLPVLIEITIVNNSIICDRTSSEALRIVVEEPFENFSTFTEVYSSSIRLVVLVCLTFIPISVLKSSLLILDPSCVVMKRRRFVF